MDKKFSYYVFGGAFIGTAFGLIWSEGNNSLVRMGIGALIGVAIGWFVAAAMLQQNKK